MKATTILVVDDERDIVENLRKILQKQGYQTWGAYDAWQALQLAGQQPALVLLDIMLPDMSGVEVLRRLKHDANTSRIPVIMVSAQGGSQYIFDTQDLQAEDYLIKPFNADELMALVKKHVPPVHMRSPLDNLG
jgi:DNA-binding response OmpR family regulator